MDATSRKNLTLATMSIATFLAILDTTAVNLALHAIQHGLKVGVSTLQWVLDAYNLTYASFILTGGVFGDLFGRRRVFVLGISLFMLASLLCALAPNPAILIAGRALAGLGSALQLPGALAILAMTFEEGPARSKAIAIWGGFNGLAMGIGPTVGGFLVDQLGWRSIFYLALPIGLGILALAVAVPESSNPEGRKVDLPGQGLSVVALGLLAFACIEAPTVGWSSPLILGALVLSLGSLVAFILVERTKSEALLPLGYFHHRMFSTAVGIAALMTFGFYALLLVFPLYLQSVRGQSAVVAGLSLLPMSLTFFALSSLAGRPQQVLSPSGLVSAGMALMSAGLFTLSTVRADSSYAVIFLGLLGMGIGTALVFGPIMTVAVSSLPSARSGTSSGMVNVGRMVGATLGVAIPGSIFGGHVLRAGRSTASFLNGMHLALFVGAFAELSGAILALVFLAEEPGSTHLVRRLRNALGRT